ncbi:MAG: ureidoglycolate lyase [Alphaproteobacteria bacterium]|nr:ureidoglycolate lyase [Alphaproteobacteria bacterium]MBL6777298.1 ureidoglycolate lyase [Alphaproteobacteria bacterium]
MRLQAKPFDAQIFAQFGDVICARQMPDKMINQGKCARYHNLAKLDFVGDGRAGISLFDAEPRALPYRLEMMERHPLGSQAFLPLHEHPFLVVVAEDDNGQPSNVQAFITPPSVGVNYHCNIWHGVLTPLEAPGLFAVVDRIGNDKNLEEFWFDEDMVIEK